MPGRLRLLQREGRSRSGVKSFSHINYIARDGSFHVENSTRRTVPDSSLYIKYEPEPRQIKNLAHTLTHIG